MPQTRCGPGADRPGPYASPGRSRTSGRGRAFSASVLVRVAAAASAPPQGTAVRPDAQRPGSAGATPTSTVRAPADPRGARVSGWRRRRAGQLPGEDPPLVDGPHGDAGAVGGHPQPHLLGTGHERHLQVLLVPRAHRVHPLDAVGVRIATVRTLSAAAKASSAVLGIRTSAGSRSIPATWSPSARVAGSRPPSRVSVTDPRRARCQAVSL